MASIHPIQQTDIPAIVSMAQILYKEDDAEMLAEEFTDFLSSEKDQVFVAKEGEEVTGFLHMSIRHDYVEGALSYPVGYMEGIYVQPDYRHQHIARQLSEAGMKWAKEKGCAQIASDAEIDNTNSQMFHQKIGFGEVIRTVSFIKNIEE